MTVIIIGVGRRRADYEWSERKPECVSQKGAHHEDRAVLVPGGVYRLEIG